MWIVSIVDSHCRVLYDYAFEDMAGAHKAVDEAVPQILARLSARFGRVWHLEDTDDEVFYVDDGLDPYVRVNVRKVEVGETPGRMYLL